MSKQNKSHQITSKTRFAREDRKCVKCNLPVAGDEFQFLNEFPAYYDYRTKSVPRKCLQSPSTHNVCRFTSSTKKEDFKKYFLALSKFVWEAKPQTTATDGYCCMNILPV